MRDMGPRVLYIVYWGALEPLGQSLVVPALLEMARLGARITLITFEKPADLADSAARAEMTSRFAAAAVEWHPLQYHKRPKWPATAFDAFAAVALSLVLSLRDRFDVVHARTFVAGPVGWLAARLTRARFVFHNEGFYPDEQVDGGVWTEGSRVHRFARWIEGQLYDRADGLVVLSTRAKDVVADRPAVRRSKTPITVVPSAVDLDAFTLKDREVRKGRVRVVYLGSVGLRYRLDVAGRFVAALRTFAPQTTLTVISTADRGLVESMLDRSGLERQAWSHRALPHSEVAAELRRHDVGLLFWPQGLSEHATSPTKVGEYWACGVAVVSTPNISDIDEVTRRFKVGVVVADSGDDAMTRAAKETLQLLEDPDLSARCRQAAEDAYSLGKSCARLLDMYARLGA